MEQVFRIRELRLTGGKTYREIGEELGVSPKTISKALNRPEAFADGYRREGPAPRPVLGNWTGRIEELLRGKSWAQETGRRVRRTSRWVYRQIRREGYEGAESTVRAFVREHVKLPAPRCPIEHRAGDEVQFDFGEYRILIAGKVERIHFVGAVFPYSTRRFLFAYPAERQECLFDAMERTYQLAGGVSERATLDNTSLAVAKVLEGRRREETEEYRRFRLSLGVDPRYTNRGAGWEKGHVEGTVGWAKRQVLCDLEVRGWNELDRVLLDACEEDARDRSYGEGERKVSELFAEEREILRPFPYEGRRSYRRVKARVSPGGLVHVDGSRYSAPVRLRGHGVRVQLFWNEVVITSKGEVVARHRRDWRGGSEHYQVEHYLELLKRAPALLDHGKPFVRMPDWLRKLRQVLRDDRDLVELLLAVESGRYTVLELERAAEEVLSSGSVTRAQIEQRALVLRHGVAQCAELSDDECGELGRHRFALADAETYNEILACGA